MEREISNKIRFLMEEILPPLLRDSWLFASAASLVWGKHIANLADFRRRAVELTSQEYESLYRAHPRVHCETDNTEACIARICSDLLGESMVDVGCGTGYLVNTAKVLRHKDFRRYVGVDFIEHANPSFEFIKAPIETLPFRDAEFDTVVCTHVIEHILDYRQAIAELRRITRRRLIIVVPREREGLYTFNPHFNFFPYKHSFLRAMIPVPKTYVCEDIGRDIYYCEDILNGADE